MADTANADTGTVTGGLRTLLRLEGLTLFAGMTLLYAVWGGSWWVYALLFFAPDVSFTAYLAGARFGAIVYNAAHSYMAPMALMTTGFADEFAADLVDRDDLAGAYRFRPRARLRPEIQRRIWLHPSRPHRQGRGGGLTVSASDRADIGEALLRQRHARRGYGRLACNPD